MCCSAVLWLVEYVLSTVFTVKWDRKEGLCIIASPRTVEERAGETKNGEPRPRGRGSARIAAAHYPKRTQRLRVPHVHQQSAEGESACAPKGNVNKLSRGSGGLFCTHYIMRTRKVGGSP